MDVYIYKGGAEKQLREDLNAMNGYDESFRYCPKLPPYGKIVIPRAIGKCWLTQYKYIWGWQIEQEK